MSGPKTWQEFIETYPDYKDLRVYLHKIILPLFKKYRDFDLEDKDFFRKYRQLSKRILKEIKQRPEYSSDMKLQRAVKCNKQFLRLYALGFVPDNARPEDVKRYDKLRLDILYLTGIDPGPGEK